MRTAKTTRRMTICSSFNKTPTVIIKGKWFEKCGFRPGDAIEIDTSENGLLIIKNKGNKFNK